MMMIIGPRHSSGAHDFRAPLEWRAPMKVFFQGWDSVDSWTLGPKPLCHRHPTGPHPSRLLWTPWTPANVASTKSKFALGARCHRVAGGDHEDARDDERRGGSPRGAGEAAGVVVEIPGEDRPQDLAGA